MLRTLKNLFKQDREKFVVPKSVQNVIPIKTIWDDGIFLVGRNKYAKTFKFEDINYAVASREDKEAMFLEYSELLNSLDSGATTKITINNRRLNKADFEQTILIPMADDGLDKYRKEYNKMLLDKATGANSIVQDKYVTVSVCKKNIEEARNYFARVGADLIAHFNTRGAYYCFGLFIYGFLVLIALITLFNIINSIAMSVVAKMKQYGVFRAIGLSNRQLAKMIIAEASTYAITGTICGSVLGIVCNKILFSKLITYKWGDAWSVPLVQLGIIIVVVAIAVILAVRNPIKKLEKTSIVDIISVQ